MIEIIVNELEHTITISQDSTLADGFDKAMH